MSKNLEFPKAAKAVSRKLIKQKAMLKTILIIILRVWGVFVLGCLIFVFTAYIIGLFIK